MLDWAGQYIFEKNKLCLFEWIKKCSISCDTYTHIIYNIYIYNSTYIPTYILHNSQLLPYSVNFLISFPDAFLLEFPLHFHLQFSLCFDTLFRFLSCIYQRSCRGATLPPGLLSKPTLSFMYIQSKSSIYIYRCNNAQHWQVK